MHDRNWKFPDPKTVYFLFVQLYKHIEYHQKRKLYWGNQTITINKIANVQRLVNWLLTACVQFGCVYVWMGVCECEKEYESGLRVSNSFQLLLTNTIWYRIGRLTIANASMCAHICASTNIRRSNIYAMQCIQCLIVSYYLCIYIYRIISSF